MFKSVKKYFFVVAATLSMATFALAWDGTGHQVVARIAWDELGKTPAGIVARDKFMAILMNGHSQFRPTSTSDAAAFAKAATFCDFIKTAPATDSYSMLADQLNDQTYPNSPEKTKDGERARCKIWHYFDTPIHLASGITPYVRPFDGRSALTRAISDIGTATSDQDKAWWAYWILHLTGDLHQPLHCTSNFTTPVDPHSGLVTGDNGGNAFLFSHARADELHAFWDSSIGNATKGTTGHGTSIAQKAATIEAACPANTFGASLSDLDPTHWVADGAAIANTKVYVGVHQFQKPSATYTKKCYKIAITEAALAGYRLAKIIQQL